MPSKGLANPNNSMDIPNHKRIISANIFIQICSLSENGRPFSHRALSLHIPPFKHQGKKNNPHHKVHSLHRPLEGDVVPSDVRRGQFEHSTTHHTTMNATDRRTTKAKNRHSNTRKQYHFYSSGVTCDKTNFVSTSSSSLSSSEEHSQPTR